MRSSILVVLVAACVVEEAPIESTDLAVGPGEHTFVRKGSEKCLDVAGGGDANGTNIHQWACHGGANQRFRFENVGGGAVRIVGVASGKCVDVAGGGTGNGTNIQLWTCGSTSNQRFKIQPYGPGTSRIRHIASNKCLDVKGGSSASGANVQLWSCKNVDAQKWALVPTDDDGGGGEVWGDAVVTAYTFQDNSACNSIMTSSGRPLVPYVSVALPFRFLHETGDGPFHLGDVIHVSFLEGRTMPNGQAHTGWVRIDDFCGDGGDDSYCFQNGKPNVDLYIGDWAHSGMTCHASDPDDFGSGWFSGPGGDGQEPTVVRFGPPPPGELDTSYGGRAMGEGRCGNCADGMEVQPPACWHYDPGDINVEYCTCDNSNGTNGQCQ